jgi:hypothetical protein
MKGITLLQREMIAKELKCTKIKKIFSRTIRLNSIKLNTNYAWVKRIQVCPNKGDNHKNVRMRWGHLKIFFRTTGPILTRLSTNHPLG